MSQKVKATVVLEFENGQTETVTIDDLTVLGSWVGKDRGQSRTIYEVAHPQVLGVYQHHNVGVALLDLLRVAVIELDPEWCKTGPVKVPGLLRPSTPEVTPEMTKLIDSRFGVKDA